MNAQKTAKQRIEANELACLEIVERSFKEHPTVYNAQKTLGFTKGTYTPHVEQIVKEVSAKYGVSKEGIELIIIKR